MSGIQMMLLGASGAAPQTASFFANLNSTTSDIRGRSSVVDSGGNMYVAIAGQGSPAAPTLVKYDSTGALVFQRQVSVSGYTLGGSVSLAIDSSDTIYFVVGEQTSNTNVLVIRLNTSGSVITAHRIGSATSPGSICAGFISGAGVLVVSGTNTSSGGTIFGFNVSSNTVSWSYRWQDSSRSMTPVAVVESPNYIYVIGSSSQPAGWMMQLSKGGTVNWTRLYGSGFYSAGAADSSDNVYIAGSSQIAKFDASFNGVTSASASVSSVLIRSFVRDTVGDFCVVGEAPVSGITSGYIAKLNTSLTFAYQRGMLITGRPTSQTGTYGSVSISRNNFFATGYAQDGALTYTDYVMSISAPLDGTKTGNYTVNRYPSETYTYQYQSFTNTWSIGGTPSTFSAGSVSSISMTVNSATASVSATSNVSTITAL